MKGPLTKTSIPLYRSLAAIIENKITTGQFDPGSQLPTEDTLARHYNVSKITVRTALMHLELDRLIIRKWGKGTFVAENIPKRKQYIHTNLNDMTRALAQSVTQPVSIETLKIQLCRNPMDIRNFFGVSGEDTIGRISRIVTMGGVPYFYENFMPVELVRHITKTELAQRKSIQKILRTRLGLKATRGKKYLEALPAEPDIARMLQCQIFDPLIHMQTYFWSGAEVPFEMVNVYFHAGYFKYEVEVEIEA
ncbi:MAG: GntR family transcriptional regulator [Thermodesulfobacteriota bacterium]